MGARAVASPLREDIERHAAISRTAYGETRRQRTFYDRLEWARDFGTDLEDLDSLTVGTPPLGVVNQWLDARDGFPTFPDRAVTAAYLAEREEHARALIAALTLRHADGGVGHASWCASNAGPDFGGPGRACTCGEGDVASE